MSATPPLDSEVMAILRCPLTGQELRMASEEELVQFPGCSVRSALISLDGQVLYPVENGLPLVVPGKAIRRPEVEEPGSD